MLRHLHMCPVFQKTFYLFHFCLFHFYFIYFLLIVHLISTCLIPFFSQGNLMFDVIILTSPPKPN
ncbi:hypothetical protein BDZ91DRAFT_745618 [Kalaharituber pfeilii]|nr:hypothetical protein BDZ91DRAFT_745618 [Kalaharituber pfeilii]